MLDDATKTIGQHWRRKNARRNGMILENVSELSCSHTADGTVAPPQHD
jgi:hypothetical protein